MPKYLLLRIREVLSYPTNLHCQALSISTNATIFPSFNAFIFILFNIPSCSIHDWTMLAYIAKHNLHAKVSIASYLEFLGVLLNPLDPLLRLQLYISKNGNCLYYGPTQRCLPCLEHYTVYLCWPIVIATLLFYYVPAPLLCQQLQIKLWLPCNLHHLHIQISSSRWGISEYASIGH